LANAEPVSRVQANLLARAERRLLDAWCRRLPPAVTPDRLSALGFGGALMVLAGYDGSRWSAAWLWLAVAGYGLHWFGDSLDGSLARFRGIERPRFGHFLDHSLDALGNMIGMVGLGLSPFVRMDVALFALVGYLLLTVHVLLRLRATGAMQLSFAGGGPTELRLGLVAATVAMAAAGPRPFAPGWSWYDLGLGGIGGLFLLLFVANTIRTAHALARAGG
jgi:phosphatidylglycerophosphate synthase